MSNTEDDTPETSRQIGAFSLSPYQMIEDLWEVHDVETVETAN